MIEFYFKNFKKTYKIKVQQLVVDLNQLFILEGIQVKKSNNDFLSEMYRSGLNESLWAKLNDLYYTLEIEKKRLPCILRKFLIKSSDGIVPKYRFIDTFSGCGGLSLGFSKAGFKPVLVNEIEPKFLETYYFNHDLPMDSYLCGDIKDLNETITKFDNKILDVDLVIGGPPCQGFSMANRQRILDDPRNDLYKQFLRLLSISRPKFFVMENVRGMINKVDEIINDFKSTLGESYSIRMILLNAKHFGVPQNRERVFVIGSRLQNVDMDDLIQNIKNHGRGRKQFLLKDALEGLPELKPKTERNNSGLENEEIGYKFRKKPIKENDFLKFIGGSTNYLTNHYNRFNNDRDVEIFRRLPQGANSLHSTIADIMPYGNRNHIFKDKFFKLNENEVCKTITSHMKFDCNMYIHPSQPRGLSPREAARIQTFPDDYVFMGAKNIWYAQIGNAVPVKLAEAIGVEIMKYLRN
jgi:DNA (cytosine-5)-methyltransferase 1